MLMPSALLALENFRDSLEWKYDLLNFFPFLLVLLLKKWQTLSEEVYDLLISLELVAHLLHIIPTLVDISCLHVFAQYCIHF